MTLRLTARLGLAALVAVATAVPLGAATPLGPGPFEADPAAISVTLDLPDGIGLMPGSAALVLRATGGPDDATWSASDPLAEPGPGVAQPGGRRHLLRLAAPRAASMTALQATVQAWRAQGLRPHGAIEVTFTPCRARPNAAAAPFALAVRFGDTGPPLALTATGATLETALGRPLDTLPPCP